MTGCLTDKEQDLRARIAQTAERLVPEVGALLEDVSSDGQFHAHVEDGTHVLSIPVRFPDGIGRGAVVARVFRYRTSVRVDLELVHDRMLADASGFATARHSFLNDFVASVSLPVGTEGLPATFTRHVRAGVCQALAAVEAHNRRHPEPWSRMRVVAA